MNLVSKALLLALPLSLTSLPAAAQPDDRWAAGWVSAVQHPSANEWISSWAQQGFADQSVRQVVRVGAEGSRLRLRLSNIYGKTPLKLTGASIGKTAKGASVRPETLRPLRFRGAAGVTIPAGGRVAADPVTLPVEAREHVTVTLYFKGATGPATNHHLAAATSFRATGDRLRDPGAGAFSDKSTSWYFLEGLDVSGRSSTKRDTVVAFGDSITDGLGSTVDADRRYPDVLADRLARRSLTVLNSGIGGNRILNDSACFGEAATARFQRDVLDQPRVRTVIAMGGINDIMHGEMAPSQCTVPRPKMTADALIKGYRALIRAARADDIEIIGGTIPPFKGSPVYNEYGEGVRDTVNTWIRTGGEFDGVADFDRALADPADPDRLRPDFDSGDHLHLSDGGYRAMAEAVDLDELSR
ncbi:SGNH/GDSL hydrolase family protein [Nonomuraea longicatena]|uniref:SGNH/GDSL hydrolase family protein n=1 Tax=Nonomuraea longicatena TaxID=83682 RepID=A0ABN1Q199_9ACTN